MDRAVAIVLIVIALLLGMFCVRKQCLHEKTERIRIRREKYGHFCVKCGDLIREE